MSTVLTMSPEDRAELRKIRHLALRRCTHLRDMLFRGINTGEDVMSSPTFIDQTRQFEDYRCHFRQVSVSDAGAPAHAFRGGRPDTNPPIVSGRFTTS